MGRAAVIQCNIRDIAEGIKTVLDKPLDIDFLPVLLSAHEQIIAEADRMAAG
jgi:hypothetical protein